MQNRSSKAYVIREAFPSEGPVLTALARRSKAYWGYSEEFLLACEEELTYSQALLESGAVMFSVLETDDGVVCGFYALTRISPVEYELEALFVEPDVIGQGFGRALVGHGKRTAKSLGGRFLTIQGDPNAEGFYRAVGGQQIGTRESDSIPGRLLPLFRIDLGGVRGT